MRWLVTGGTGFVGRHLIARIRAEGHTVRAVVRDAGRAEGLDVEVVGGGLESADTVARALEGVDVVVHAAGGGRDPDLARVRANNVGVTEVLLEAIRSAGQRPLVFLSSIAARGPSAAAGRDPLGTVDAPRSTYGRSKLDAEERIRGAGGAAILRLPAVYGPGDANLLPLFRAARTGLVPVLSGDRSSSLIHVEDVAEAVVAAGTLPGKWEGTWFIDDGVVHGWTDLVAALGRAVGRKVVAVRIPAGAIGAAARLAERLPIRPFLTRDKAADMLGEHWVCGHPLPADELWKARVKLEIGFAETAQWYRERGWRA